MELEIIVQKFGETPDYKAAEVDGMFFINDGKSKVYIQNFSGQDTTAEFIEQETCDFEHAQINDQYIASSGGVTRIWMTLNRYRYNDGAGKAHFTLSETGSVWVAVISDTPQES